MIYTRLRRTFAHSKISQRLYAGERALCSGVWRSWSLEEVVLFETLKAASELFTTATALFMNSKPFGYELF